MSQFRLAWDEIIFLKSNSVCSPLEFFNFRIFQKIFFFDSRHIIDGKLSHNHFITTHLISVCQLRGAGNLQLHGKCRTILPLGPACTHVTYADRATQHWHRVRNRTSAIRASPDVINTQKITNVTSIFKLIRCSYDPAEKGPKNNYESSINARQTPPMQRSLINVTHTRW